MPRWFLCLCRLSRLNAIKEHGRDRLRYAYIPERFRSGSVSRQRGCGRGVGAPERERVETLEPRLLFSGSPLASLDVFGLEQDEAGVVLDVLANDEEGGGALSLTGFTPGAEAVGDANSGVLGNDGDSGTAYLMYSAEATHTRFSGFAASQADHLVTVKHNGTDWLLNYFVSGQGDTWTAFTPVSSDVLVAEITMQAGDDAIASLEGESFVVEGIEAGYASGDLAFIANQWQDVYNRDEYDVTGTTFTRNIRTEHGHVVDNGDGTLTYTPDAGFTGSDRFLYTASDGQTYSVSASDLEAHYLFGEGAGTSAADDSGNGLTLTLSGAGWAEGRAGAIGGTGGGGALLLDGVDDFASTTGLTSTSQMTLSAWVRPDALGGEQTILGQSGSFAFKLSGSQLRFTAPGVADHTVAAGVADLVAGQWQHVAVSFDTGQTGGAKFYVDGELVATLDASAMGTNSNDLWIGKNQWGEFFGGAVDDVRIDSRLLSGDEVAVLAEASTAAVSLSVNALVDIEAARDTLLAGVTSLADPGSPGHMIAYGPTAFSVSNYAGADLGDPMIAAATWGAGRVVALPDHQWLELTTHGGDASTAAFYGNGIEWLADSAALSVKVVTYNHTANASWLTAQGYTNVVNATSATLAAELADADVLVGGWLGTNPPEADLDTIADFVANQGGGLFIADYGIGYDWWWGQATEDIPSNRLLREVGIGFVKAYPHGGGAQTISRAVGQVTADDILALLHDSSGATQAEKDQAAAIYTTLNGLLAEDDALQAELDAAFWSRINTINPTPSTPVSDSFEKALLQREMDLLGVLPPAEVTAHRTAEDVYGAIDVNAPRLTNQSVTIDADTTGLIATGLYAAPGDLVTVTLPAALVGQGYTLRINSHVDSIAGHSSYARVPYNVSRSFAIDSATVQVANAFGGHIYLDMGGQAGGASSGLGSQQITIDGAIAAPMFVLGQTTDAQWIDTIRDNPAPYAEFVSEHLAFSVPSDWVRTLDNPTQLMQYWDDAVSFMDYVAGTEALRTGPERINLDVAISVGLLHAGYPIQGPTSYGDSIVDLDALTSGGDWGWFHELGHEIQRQTALGWGWDNPWTFGGDVEVTVNIFANAALELLAPGTGTAGWGYSAHAEEVMARAVATINDTNAPNFDQKDPYPFYFQLADGFGWDMYRTVLGGYVDDVQNNPANLPQDNQQEKDQWLTRWSAATGYNLVDYMVNQWGLEVSQSAIDAVNAMSLPSWLPVVPNDTTHRVAHAGSLIFDPAVAGIGLDATATFVGVAAASAQGGAITLNADGTYTFTPDADFVGADLIDVTYQSSAGNTVTTAIRVEVYELAAQPDKDQWTLVSTDSEETVGENGAAINAFDGDTNTIWHTQWNGGSPTHPHELVIDLGGRYDLDGFTYTPRQSGTNGRIANYEFYTSNDGVTWGNPVTTGTFANNASPQSATFTPTAGRYIKLVALSEVNGNAWSSVAELDVSGTLAAPNSDDFDLFSTSSEETVGEDGAATNAFDGDPGTIWHSRYIGGTDAHPHELVLDLGARFDLDGFTYLPRQNGVNGRIADYAFYTSLDGINWGAAVATGTFANTADLQTVGFTQTTGQFIKLVALSEVNGNPWTSVAELGVSGVFASAGEVAPVAADDTVDVLMDQPNDLDVIGNDIDPDRGETFTINIIGQGAHGTATDNGNGGIAYTPDAGYYGTDALTYAVTDATGRTSNTATVTINVGGLVSHWALDEGTGTTTADTQVNNAVGTITNATWTTGVHNNALDFNGQDSVVNLGTAASLSGTTDFTAAVWINTTDTNGGTIIQQRDNGSPGYEGQYRFRMNADGTLNFFIYNGGQQFNLSTTQAVNDGRWHHVAAQRDGLEGRIYIDGQLAASVTGSEIKALSPAISVAIGANIRDNDDFFKGTIDDVQLHSRSIDASEVAALYQAMPNLAPSASTDHFTTAVNTPATISPLGNDFDHNAADTLSIASFTQPIHGTVTDNGDGTLTYTPITGVGATHAQFDNFTYTVSDGNGNSTTATALVTIGETQVHSDFNTTGGTTQVTATGNHQYELNLDFTNAPATIDQLIIDWGNGQITHGTTSGGWGDDLTQTAPNQWTTTKHVYDKDLVQHIKVFAVDTAGKVQQSKVILNSTLIPVFNVTAEALSSSEVRVAFAHRFASDVPYRVSATPAGGPAASHVVTTRPGATFALFESLLENTTYTYEVQPDLGPALAFEAPAAAAAPLQQPPAGPGGGAQVRYRVAVETPQLQHGSAGYSGVGEASIIDDNSEFANDVAGIERHWEYVLAVSPEAAIYKAVQGSAFITANDVPESRIFTFGQDAAFKVGTYGDLKNAINGYNITADPGDGQYLITLEDSFQWTNIDFDFDDWYWEVLVEPLPGQVDQAVDLDVDSDNDSGFVPPFENTDAEDNREDFKGKLVDVGRFDVDRDGIPDFADGFDGLGGAGGADAVSQGEQFVPILIRIDEAIDLETATVTFTYSASDPAAVTATPVPFFPDTYIYTPGPGHLRLWTKDGGVARHEADDYVGSGAEKPLSALPVFNADERVFILWVEGVQADAGQQTEPITITLNDPAYTGGKVLEDTVLIDLQDPSQALVDLDIDSDNLGGLQRDDAEEAVEEIGGKITALSIQDLNGNSIPDFADSQGVAGLEFAEMALELRPPVPHVEYQMGGDPVNEDAARAALLEGARITFEYDDSAPFQGTGGSHTHLFDPYTPKDGLLRIWMKNGTESRGLSDFIESGVTYTGKDLGLGNVGAGSTASVQSVLQLWVEAVDASGANVPIKVTVTFGDTPSSYTRPEGGGGSQGTSPPPPEASTQHDIVYVRPGGVDLDIDSDNNGEYAAGDLAEDVLEDVGVGKVLVTATSDRDGSGTLDFTDGFEGASGVTGEHLVPLDLTLPEWITSPLGSVGGEAWVVFNYAASSPLGWGGSAATHLETNLPPGNLRLWTQNTARDANSAADGGHFVANAQKSLSSHKLGESIAKTHFESHRIFLSDLLTQDGKVRVFAEAIAAPEDGQPLEIEVIFGTTFDLDDPARERDVLMGADTVRVTVVEPAVPFADGIGLNQVGDGLDGGNPLLDAFMGPVRLDGQLASLASPEISGDPFAWAFGHNRVWSDDPVAGLGALAGPGHMIADLPFLVHGTSTMIAVFSPTNQLYFDRIADETEGPDEYAARFFAQDTLEVTASDNTIKLIDSAGNTFTFHGYAHGEEPGAVPDPQKGKLKKIETASGHEIDFKYKDDDSGLLEDITREIGAGVQEKLAFVYASPIEIATRTTFFDEPHDRPILHQPSLKTVKLYRVEGTQETVTRSVMYDYYTGDEGALASGEKPGRPGDLKTANVMIHHNGDEDGQLIDQTYYRYEYQADEEQSGGSGGSTGGGGGAAASDGASPQDLPLTRLVTMDNAAIARAGVPLDAVATDTLIDTHGATAITTRHHADGPGFTTRGLGENASAADGEELTRGEVVGLGGYGIDVQRADALGPNGVRYTVTVTPDANIPGHAAPVQTFELNHAREVLNHKIMTSEGEWESGFNYDPDARLLSASSPSDLTTVYKYYGENEGDNSGRLHEVWIASNVDPNAANYRADLLTTYAYTKHNDVVWIDTITEQGGGGPEALPWVDIVTDFDYTTDDAGNLVVTTNLPDTTATGGQTASFSETFDTHGNLIKLVDAVGVEHYSTYSPTGNGIHPGPHLTQYTQSSDPGAAPTTTVFDDLGQIKYTQYPDGTRTYYHLYQTDTTLEVTVQTGWPATGGAPLGNAVKTVTDLATGKVTTTVYAPNAGQSPSDFDDFTQQVQGLGGAALSTTEEAYDKGGRLIMSEVTQAAGVGAGALPKTTYIYDDYGRVSRTHRFYDDGGSIKEETEYDQLGRITKLLVAGQVVQSFEYDGGQDGGDSNITKATLHPGDGASARQTLNVYDWRNRLVASKQGDQGGGAAEADINRPLAVHFYDNLDQLYKTNIYDGDGADPTYDLASDQVTLGSSVNSDGLQRTDYTDFDARGQIYQTRSVDPDPQANFTVTTGLWYDALGRIVKEKAPGGLTTKITYDALGRATDIYLTDDATGGVTVGNDTQLEHTHTDYDAAGNAIFTKTTQHDNNPGGTDRLSAVSQFYDALGRLTTHIDHGTHGAALTQQTDVARGSTSARRTDISYSISSTSGQLQQTVTDNAGAVRASWYDGLGRLASTLDTYDVGTVLSPDQAAGQNGLLPGSQPGQSYFYDGLGRLTAQSFTAGPYSDLTRTEIEYSVGANPSRTTKTWDDWSSGSPGSADETHTDSLNQLGQVIESTLAAGLSHTYTYDVLGRLIRDTTTPASGQQSVVTGEGRYRTYAYDTLGNATEINEYNPGASGPRSTVTQQFNAFGLLTDYTSTNYGNAEHVQYHYDDANGGVRATGLTYPDGTAVGYTYDPGIDDAIGRVSEITLNGTALEAYNYLGVASPQTITKHLSGGGDITETRTYDAFGRLRGQDWAGVTDGALEFLYDYDAAGNLTYINDRTSVDHNSSFTYNIRGQLTGFWFRDDRASTTVVVDSEGWKADKDGLHRSVEAGDQRLSQQDAVRPTFQGWVDEDDAASVNNFDYYLENWALGLLGSADRTPKRGLSVQFDPWGRVVGRKAWRLEQDGSSIEPYFEASQQYVYDALGRLVRLNQKDDTGTPSHETHTRFVTDAFGRVLLEELHDVPSGTDDLESAKRFVWSPVTGQLIYRERDANANGVYEQRYFTGVDLQGNTVAVFAATDGEIKARLWYTPSGEVGVVTAVNGVASLSSFLATTDFRHLFGQGRLLAMPASTTLASAGHPLWFDAVTVRAGGSQYDALLNGVVRVNRQAFVDDVNGVVYENITWWDRYWHETLTAVHLGLDVVGIFDPTPISDGLNALIYLGEAVYYFATDNNTAAYWSLGNAGISVVAIIPYVGDLSKLGRPTARAGLTAARASSTGRAVLVRGTVRAPELVGTGVGAGVGYYHTGTLEGTLRGAAAGGGVVGLGRVGVGVGRVGLRASGEAIERVGRPTVKRNTVGRLYDTQANRYVHSRLKPLRDHSRRIAKTLNPLHYTSSRIKGILGREISILQARLRGEALIGRELKFTVNGVDSFADAVTRTRSGQLRILEAKFGPTAGLSDNQILVQGFLAEGHAAVFSGGRSFRAFNVQSPLDVGNVSYRVDHYFENGYWRWFG